MPIRMSILNKYTDSLEFWQPRIKNMKFLIEVINTNLIRHFDAEEDFGHESISHKMSTLNTNDDEIRDVRRLTSSNRISIDDQQSIDCFGPSYEIDERLEEIASFYTRLNRDTINQFLDGAELIWVPAVTTVQMCINKILNLLEPELIQLNEKPDREQHKKVYGLATKLSWCFDYLYAAMQSKRTSPFYKSKGSKYLK